MKSLKLILAAASVALGLYYGEPTNFLMFCLAGGIIINLNNHEQSKTKSA